jgi:hypothetical protein
MEDASCQTKKEYALQKLPNAVLPTFTESINGSQFAWQPG